MWIVTIDKPHVYEQAFTTWTNLDAAKEFYQEALKRHISINNNDCKICLCKVKEYTEKVSVGV